MGYDDPIATSLEMISASENDVGVVITTYNMAWCVSRAVASCRGQTKTVKEIVIVDDCSTDETVSVVNRLAEMEPRIKLLRLDRNCGHLAALRVGVANVTADWAVLLDADDELLPDSVMVRVRACEKYREKSGEVAQLIYGDTLVDTGTETYEMKFHRLSGVVYAFMSKEMCLCQTSTIMLGRQCFEKFPTSNNPWNTDDEIVIAISKWYPILHSGAVVSIYHCHGSPTKMGNNARRKLSGVRTLVREHQAEIIRMHGVWGLMLWRLRVLRALVRYGITVQDGRSAAGHDGRRHLTSEWLGWTYGAALNFTDKVLTRILRLYFVLLYF